MINEILGKNYDETLEAIYQYLLNNSSKFRDHSLFKAVQINCINASSTDLASNEFILQSENLKDKLLKSDERSDLKYLSILLVDLNNENWQEAAYTLWDKLDYGSLDKEFLDKIELLRRLVRLVYLHIDDKLIPTLHRLMEILPQDISPSKILWEFFDMDSDPLNYSEQLISMANVILEYRPDDPETNYFLGFILYIMEDFQSSMKHYKSSLNLCYTKSELYGNIGLLLGRIGYCHLSLGEYSDAINCASIAIVKYEELRSQDNSDKMFYPMAYTLRARAYIEQGRYELAKDDILLGLEYDSDNEDLNELLQEINGVL
ncbi:MAG TPA: hypothetical protein PK784_05535 [Tenuifilaceae bacterium]|nr:hypothetical protein [Tenuifilaceae bacterium]HPN21590.1 hypothetical protein [Tenuifilaceae bacterium]